MLAPVVLPYHTAEIDIPNSHRTPRAQRSGTTTQAFVELIKTNPDQLTTFTGINAFIDEMNNSGHHINDDLAHILGVLKTHKLQVDKITLGVDNTDIATIVPVSPKNISKMVTWISEQLNKKTSRILDK